jgi:hypothetical protein
MATYLENLQTRRTAVAAELAALDATKPGGLPDIRSRDGGTDIEGQKYKMNLYDELSKLDRLIKEAAAVEDTEPFEISTNMNGNFLGW